MFLLKPSGYKKPIIFFTFVTLKDKLKMANKYLRLISDEHLLFCIETLHDS